MKLALGTAQFGLDYGVANKDGKISYEEARAILEYATRSGIDTLDTAIAYGESEKCLGDFGVTDWKVVSKLPGLPESVEDMISWVSESVQGSLQRLRLPKLKGLLLHRPQDLLGVSGENLYCALLAAKRQGLVEKIGISIYGPEELDSIWPHFHFDLVQAPYNVIDRRIARSGWLNRLHGYNVEVHTRSAFLQGLLLMAPSDRPEAFRRWQPMWDMWHQWLEEQSKSPLEACLGFVLSQPEVDRVVVGVDSLRHLAQIAGVPATDILVPDEFETNDEDLINPSRWSLL